MTIFKAMNFQGIYIYRIPTTVHDLLQKYTMVIPFALALCGCIHVDTLTNRFISIKTV